MIRVALTVLAAGSLLSAVTADAGASAHPRPAQQAAARNALDTLRGHVSGPNGRPLPGASVSISELGRTVLADTAGAFAIADVPAGRYTLVVRRLGYAPVAIQVASGAASPLDVQLRETALRFEPVTVTATRTAIDPLSSPLPVAALGEEQLRREHGVSLAHALERLPRIRTLSTGEQIGKPVIRGLSGPRVLVLDNGNRLEDYSWSEEDGPSVDARLDQRVEVIRGPASVLYGSDAWAVSSMSFRKISPTRAMDMASSAAASRRTEPATTKRSAARFASKEQTARSVGVSRASAGTPTTSRLPTASSRTPALAR